MKFRIFYEYRESAENGSGTDYWCCTADSFADAERQFNNRFDGRRILNTTVIPDAD